MGNTKCHNFGIDSPKKKTSEVLTWEEILVSHMGVAHFVSFEYTK